MSVRRFFQVAVLAAALGSTGTARAESAMEFVSKQHAIITGLLQQPKSAQRDAALSRALHRMVDYDRLTASAFGAHWSTFDDDQKVELRNLLRQIIEANYRKKLVQTLDYNVDYKLKGAEAAETRVGAVAKVKEASRRIPDAHFEYLVVQTPNGPKVTDIALERASMVKVYYEQFHSMLTDDTKGYAHVVATLRKRIAQL